MKDKAIQSLRNDGLTLVQTLVRQLRSQLDIGREDGTSFDITFTGLPSTTLLSPKQPS